MWEAIKKYDWSHLISDLIVVLIATALTFLLDKIKALNLGALGAGGAGGVAFITNRIKHIIC